MRISVNRNTDSFITDLSGEWNLIGIPFDESVDKIYLTVLYIGTYYSWINATTSNTEEGAPLVLSFVYGWNRVSQSYILSDYIDFGYGYWMYAYYPCRLFRKTS